MRQVRFREICMGGFGVQHRGYLMGRIRSCIWLRCRLWISLAALQWGGSPGRSGARDDNRIHPPVVFRSGAGSGVCLVHLGFQDFWARPCSSPRRPVILDIHYYRGAGWSRAGAFQLGWHERLARARDFNGCPSG